MHQGIPEYNPQAIEAGQIYEAMTQAQESFPISAQASQQGDVFSNHSSPSPSPPAGPQPQSAGRQRSRSGTASMTMQQLNKKRQRATPEQLAVLEDAFEVNSSPNAKVREVIAERIRMTERSVQIWFQNRRAKVKQMQRKEAGDDGALMFGGMGTMDHMKRNVLMRSNSLGHGGGLNNLPPDIRNAMRAGVANGPLTPAASPSNKQVIIRLSIETLSIGPWHRIACTSMDLICYFSPHDGLFAYYINSSSAGFKIEFPVTFIRSIKMEHIVRKKNSEPVFASGGEVTHRARIMIELVSPPMFLSEQRRPPGWQYCQDFTQGLVASTILVHSLVGPYDVLHAQMTELAAMSPELNSRLWIDDQPIYLPSGEDEHSSTTPRDQNRRHSTTSGMPPPPQPASAIPASFVRQHLTPGPVFSSNAGGPRVRQSFQAHRRTRSRSLPTSVNVSEMALAVQNMNNSMVPGMKFGHDVPQYVPVAHDIAYNPATPLRIDTSVADSTMDYYRQFTPSSNISSQVTPVDYVTSPASQIPLPTSLPFFEGSEYQAVGASPYANTAIYPTEGMETPTMYTESVHQPTVMNLDPFQPQETFTYTANPTMASAAPFTATAEQWGTQATQVGVTTQIDVEHKDMQSMVVKGHDATDAKMKMDMDE